LSYWSPVSQESNEVNDFQNLKPRLTHDPYSNTYNPTWKNFSYGSNPNSVNMAPMNARVPLGFQRPLFPPQMPQKTNLEAMMESMLMAQQKQEE